MDPEHYDIQRISAATGLEESVLRFYERAFADFLPAKLQAGDRSIYPEAVLAILRNIHSLVHDQKLSVAEVKRHLRGERAKTRLELQYARVMVVASGKGGVGKTNVAVNLAVELERLGKKSIVFDADFGLANVHILTGVTPKKSLVHVAEGRVHIGEALAEGPEHIGIVAGGSGVLALADLSREQRERLIEGLHDLERCADVIIVDAAPGISANVLDFIRSSDEVLLICTPDLLSITDAYGLLKAMSQRGIGVKVKIIANQVRTAAEAADVCSRIERAASQFLHREVEVLGYVLKDSNVPASAHTLSPVTVAYPKSKASRCFARLAAQLDGSEIHARKTSSTFARFLDTFRKQGEGTRV